MQREPRPSRFGSGFKDFIASIRRHFRHSDRPRPPPYLRVFDEVLIRALDAASRTDSIHAFDAAWTHSREDPNQRLSSDMLALEMRSFSGAVQKAHSQHATGEVRKSWWRRIFSIGKEIVHSLIEVLVGHLPDWLKRILQVLEEGLSFVTGELESTTTTSAA